jgi:hypothetical protein
MATNDHAYIIWIDDDFQATNADVRTRCCQLSTILPRCWEERVKNCPGVDALTDAQRAWYKSRRGPFRCRIVSAHSTGILYLLTLG